MVNTFTNSGNFDGLDATLQLTLPVVAGDELHADIQLSQAGVEPVINITFAIDRSGSSGNNTGIDFTGDGNTDTFLEAQVFALEAKLGALVAAGYDPASINVTIVDYGPSANSFSATLADADDLIDYADGLNSSGTTNYAAALAEVENSWDSGPAEPTDTNILYFYSDGFPVPSNQDYQTPLTSLEGAYSPLITAVGFGPNSSDDDLDVIDSSGNAAIVTTEQELIDLIDTPPPLPDVDSFDVFVDGTLIETIPIDDPRIIVNATGLTISNLNITGYPTMDDTPQDIDVQVVTNFSNGESLPVNGPVKILDGVVEGTAAGDLIDDGYLDDPEGDRVDNQDNIDPNAAPDELDDDLIEAGGGDDTVLAAVGDDTVFGEEGDDSIEGGIGDDVIDGGEGDDIILGGTGDDDIDGGADDDSIDAGDGSDIVDGGDGNDTILGGGDNDDLNGGADRDTIIIDQLGTSGMNNTTVDGGSTGDDFDTLDITPLRDDGWKVVNFIKNPENVGNPGFNGQIQLERGGETANINYTDIEELIVCFTPGSRIVTQQGARPVEELAVGDKVFTRDNGLQAIRWVGRRDLGASELAGTPGFQPILIRRGALGGEMPDRDMLVSPNHRMLLSNALAEVMFGEREVLVSAKHLTGLDGVDRAETGEISYIHLMFDHHEVVLADGAWSESFQPGDYSLRGIAQESRAEILALFPELSSDSGLEDYQAARRSLKAHEARLLVKETAG